VLLYLADAGWKEELKVAASEARLLGTQLELIVFLSDAEGQLQHLVEGLRDSSAIIMSILLLDEDKGITSPAVLQKAYSYLKTHWPQVKVGYGTDGFFAELNRNRPDQNLPFDFLSFSLNPQVHASDTRSLIENLQAQGDTIKTVQAFAPGKVIHVSPVTLKIREGISIGMIPVDKDNRLYTAFGAMWTLLAMKNLAGAGSITFYQAKSYRGVINEDMQRDGSPLYQLLKQLKSFHPKWIIQDEKNSNTFLVENEQGSQVQFAMQDPT
jgi:hypothetical protein